jgi:alkylated DNA repair dioxygenase AlkB
MAERDPGYRYVPGFLAADEADALLHALRATSDWQRESFRIYGRTLPVPRSVAWCGDAGLNYRYTGVDHRCTGWAANLLPLRQRVAEVLGWQPNLVLLNRYRDGRDYMGYHTDDESGHGPWVASVSLGATRRFLVRTDGVARSTRRVADALALAHGSLLVLRGDLPHALPRTVRPVGERINLTFRRIDSGSRP